MSPVHVTLKAGVSHASTLVSRIVVTAVAKNLGKLFSLSTPDRSLKNDS